VVSDPSGRTKGQEHVPPHRPWAVKLLLQEGSRGFELGGVRRYGINLLSHDLAHGYRVERIVTLVIAQMNAV
jgi:hypothetical protein